MAALLVLTLTPMMAFSDSAPATPAPVDFSIENIGARSVDVVYDNVEDQIESGAIYEYTNPLEAPTKDELWETDDYTDGAKAKWWSSGHLTDYTISITLTLTV